MISKIWNTSVCVAPPFHPPLPSHSLFLSHFFSPSLLLSAPSFSLVTSLSLPYLSCLVFPVLTWTRAVLWEYGPLFVKQNAKVCVSVCVSADVSDYMWVSLRLCVHSVCVSLWLVSDGIQSHEASPPNPLAIQQSFNPHHQWPQTPASNPFVHTDAHRIRCTGDHTHTCAPHALSFSSYQCRLALRQRIQKERIPSTLLLFVSTNHHTNLLLLLPQTSF